MVAGFLTSTLLSGSLISALGYYTPFMLTTSILAPIATALLTTLAVDTPTWRIVCNLAFIGLACGIGYQSPVIAAQTVLPPRDAPIGMAAVNFAKACGPAVSLAAAQTLFTTRLASDMAEFAPGVNATALGSMGLSDLAGFVGKENLVGALNGYDHAVAQTFYLTVGLTCVSLVGSLVMEWRSVKKKTS